MVPYEILHHTADTGIEATSPTLEGLIAEIATGMFALVVDVGEAGTTSTLEVHVDAASLADLVVDTLSELLYLFEVSEIVPVDVSVESTDRFGVEIRFGAVPREDAVVVGPEIKAVTYHGLEVAETETGWAGRVYFDV